MFIQNLSTEFKTFSKEHWALTSVLLWSSAICILSLTYISIGIFWWSIIPTIALGIIGIRFVISNIRNLSLEKPDINSCLILLADTFLVITLWHTRTDSPLQSPWSQIPSWFFLAFFLITGTLLFTLFYKKQCIFSFITVIAHTLLFYSIALLTFRFGYAYDPLIHQAAEKYVELHGKITPLQPFYIGQYALVTTLHIITRIPIEIVDRLLLSILSGISIPVVGYFGLTRGWEISKKYAPLATCGLLIIPLAEFTFTVPYNIAVLMLVWWILLLPYALKSRLGIITLYILALASTTFHPLIGIPLIISTTFAIILKKFPRWQLVIFGTFIIGVSLAGMLSFYRVLRGEHFITGQYNLENFFRVFSFTRDMARVRPRIQLLYGLNFLAPYLIVITGIFLSKRSDRITRLTLFSISGGIFFGIFLISTLISIPGIVNYEQNEFVLRLKNILPLFFIPFIISHTEHVRHKKIAIILCATLITVSLYFTYPRVDGAASAGWNVGSADRDVTKNIPQLAKNKPYIVISNQILAATGLRELGFDHRLIIKDTIDTYPYSIGMSEPIYPLTQKILYEELNGVDVRTLAHLISGQVFVAIHNYWYRFDEIANEARIAGADNIYQFDGITVYEFN